MNDRPRTPSRIKVQDKRRTSEPASGASAPDAGHATAASSEATGQHHAAATEPQPAPDQHPAAGQPVPDQHSAAPQPAPEQPTAATAPPQPSPDYLDDLRRLQAEFDNFRKRAVREQTAMAGRASAGLIEKLLPVLDNFEAAVAHGEGGPGVAMVHKQLRSTLEEQGLEEIPAEGVPFDPTLHDAFEAHEDESVTEPTSVKAFRRGYKIGGHVVRHAMVSVARPVEGDDSRDAAEG
jgi:molecular chaperone GrpE